MGETTEHPARKEAIQHAQEALEAKEIDEAKCHIKETIQLLDIHARLHSNRQQN